MPLPDIIYHCLLSRAATFSERYYAMPLQRRAIDAAVMMPRYARCVHATCRRSERERAVRFLDNIISYVQFCRRLF